MWSLEFGPLDLKLESASLDQLPRELETEENDLRIEFEKAVVASARAAYKLMMLHQSQRKHAIERQIMHFQSIVNCYDLLDCICSWLSISEKMNLTKISRHWRKHITTHFEKIEATLLPDHSRSERRAHYSSVFLWLRELNRGTFNLKIIRELKYDAFNWINWTKELAQPIPDANAEWLRISLQHYSHLYNRHLLCLSVGFNETTSWTKVLLEHKTDIATIEGEPSLMDIALSRESGSGAFVSLLLDFKANPLPSHLVQACRKQDSTIAQLLIQHGCDPFLADCFHLPDASREVKLMLRQNFVCLARRFQIPFTLEILIPEAEDKEKVHFIYHDASGKRQIFGIPLSLAEAN